MSTNTTQIFDLTNLANQLLSHVTDSFTSISVSPSQAIANFPPGATNFIYVLYSQNGMPLSGGLVTVGIGKREINKIAQDVLKIAESGMVSSFRFIEFADERFAKVVAQWVSDLFGSTLSLSGLNASDGVAASVASDAPKRRGRPAGSGKKSWQPKKAASDGEEAPKRRGRPRKNAAEPVVAKSGSLKLENIKRRGRPRKIAAAELVVAKKTVGRPKKSQVIDATPVKKNAGRPRKTVAATTKIGSGKRGRPRKLVE